MPTSQVNKRRMAKNTAILYVRMCVVMAISFYTSRIILDALGVEDFGIYNVVGGIVILFSFINTSMTAATQRFLNFYMGRGDEAMVARVYSASVTIHWLIALAVVVGGETIGLWLLYCYIDIPDGMFSAAFWTYQFSILATCATVVRTPMQAVIIAHEEMRVYAYLSILDAVLKLAIAYCVFLTASHRLVFYSACLFGGIALVSFLYYAVCRVKYRECVYRFFVDRGLYKTLLSFSGWSLMGALANTCSTQGTNIVLNVFCGVTLNAAMGIAHQVQMAVASLVSNFQTAFGPQLVKAFAAGEKASFEDLTMKAAKYSYFLLIPFVIPVFVCCDQCLSLWLTDVPPFTVSFCRLVMLYCLADALQAPLWVAVQAIGRIKTYQIIISVFIFLNLPLSYLALLLGCSPNSVLVIRVAINILIIVYRLAFLRSQCRFPVLHFVREVLLPVALISIVAYGVVANCEITVPPLLQIIWHVVISVVVTLPLILLFGFTSRERSVVKGYISRKIG